MIGAHAQQYGMDQRYNNYELDYGMDNSYDDKQSYGKDNSYPSKDSSSVSVKKIKCNNINVNLNGDIDIGASQALDALATEAQAEDEGANGASSGNDGRGDGRSTGHDSNSRFVCINNNNNKVVAEEPIPPTPCELCFAELSTQAKDNINNFLAAQWTNTYSWNCTFSINTSRRRYNKRIVCVS